jgi:predicted O-linked N-acetylglucosamine transferase (SPINDLY family)
MSAGAEEMRAAEAVQRGLALHQQSRLDEAQACYRQALQWQAHNADALHFLGVIALQRSEIDTALDLISRATMFAPRNAAALNNLGNAQSQAGWHERAVESFGRAIGLQPDFADAYYNRGNSQRQLRQPQAAVDSYDVALRLRPDYVNAYNNRGLALVELTRYEAALESYRLALVLKPDFGDAHRNCGTALLILARYESAATSYRAAIGCAGGDAVAHKGLGDALRELKEFRGALASYDNAIACRGDYAQAHHGRALTLGELGQYEAAVASFDRAVALNPQDPETYYDRGNALRELGRNAAAVSSYDEAIARDARHFRACNNRGLVLAALRRYEDAVASYDRAIAASADYAAAHSNRGAALCALGRYELAAASYARAITLDPDNAAAHNNLGNALRELKQYEAAIASYDRAIALDSKFKPVHGECLHTKMQICDWREWHGEVSQLIAGIERNEPVANPFFLLAASDSPEAQRKAAEIWVRDQYPADRRLASPPRRPASERIRLGYFSADFHDHATMHLMAGLFEEHDRAKFDIKLVSFGVPSDDPVRHRLLTACEHIIDVRTKSDHEAALLARDLGIDIAIDLKGFTEDHRLGIFAARAAPLQVSYLGYPGTTGASYIDYLLADRTLVPPDSLSHYSEKVAYLPHSYQVNDRHRRIAEMTYDRESVGLPAAGFVFCCLNNTYKITPDTFSSWVRILRAVPGSVLWLFAQHAGTIENLRREARQRGIEPERLVFAKRVPAPEHLARLRVADLFIDTWPCNAHTTASDALWAGLPVLTCAGRSFAGRVAASLLTALDLPELVTGSPEEYEGLAVALATDPSRLGALKSKLAHARLTKPLFDTRLFARHLESAYRSMMERHRAGLPTEHLYIKE